MPDDYTDTRNGAYDTVTEVGKEPYFRRDEDGNLQQVWMKPIPLGLAREPAHPLNRRTGRKPTG